MVAAFVFIQAAAGTTWSDASAAHMALHAIPGVKTVHFVTGPLDVIAFVEVADMKALADTVSKMRAVKGVGSTDTRIVLPI